MMNVETPAEEEGADPVVTSTPTTSLAVAEGVTNSAHVPTVTLDL